MKWVSTLVSKFDFVSCIRVRQNQAFFFWKFVVEFMASLLKVVPNRPWNYRHQTQALFPRVNLGFYICRDPTPTTSGFGYQRRFLHSWRPRELAIFATTSGETATSIAEPWLPKPSPTRCQLRFTSFPKSPRWPVLEEGKNLRSRLPMYACNRWYIFSSSTLDQSLISYLCFKLLYSGKLSLIIFC